MHTKVRRSFRIAACLGLLSGAIGLVPLAEAAGPVAVSVSPETATTPSGAPVTFTLTVSCSVTGGCNDTKVSFPSTTLTGDGTTTDFASWVGNSSCSGVTRTVAGGTVTFNYGAVPTGTKQCSFPVSPPDYTTYHNARASITPTISGSNFDPATGSTATLTVTAEHTDRIVKNAPVTVTSGLPFTYTLRFYCGKQTGYTGDTGLTALTIRDPLPANFTYQSYEAPKPLPGTVSYDGGTRTLTYSDPSGSTCRSGGPYTLLDNHQNLVLIYVTGTAADGGVAAPVGSQICNTARAEFTYIDGTDADSTSPEVCSKVAGRVPNNFLGKPTNAATFSNAGQYRFGPDNRNYPYTFPGDWDASGTSAVFQIQLVQTVPNAGAMFGVQDPLPCLTKLSNQIYYSNSAGEGYCPAPAFIPTLITATGFTPAAVNRIVLTHPDGSFDTVDYTPGTGWVIPVSPPVSMIDFLPFAEEGTNTGTNIFFNISGYASPLALPGSLLVNTVIGQALEVESGEQLVPGDTATGSILVADPATPSGTVVRPVIRAAKGAGCSETIGFTTPGAPFYNSIELAAAPSQAIYVDYLAPAGATGIGATDLSFTLEQMHTGGGWHMMGALAGGQKFVTPAIAATVTPNHNGTGRTLYQWRIPAGTITQAGLYAIRLPDMTVTLEPGCAGTYQNDLTVGYGAPVVSCLYGDYFPSTALPPENPSANADLSSNATPLPGAYCGNSAPLPIAAVNPGFRVDKTVQGNLDAGPVSSGGIGSVSPTGGVATYAVTFTNSGGANLANPVLYDLLPRVGDTAASSLSPRNSQFAVTLTGVGPVPPGVTVSYSTAANPCRPEVSTPIAGCVNDWTTTAPSPLSSVTALKFAYNGTIAVVGAPGINSFTVPFTVSTEAAEPGKVAWNSVGSTALAGVGGSLIAPAESSVTGLRTLAGPTIVKASATPGYAKPGDAIGYTFTVTNNTAVPLTGVSVVDGLVDAPAGAVAPAASCQSLSSPAGACSGPTTMLQPNQSATFVATSTATQADIDHGSLADEATVTAMPPTGGVLTATSNTVRVPATQTGGLSLVKSADPAGLTAAGQAVTYHYDVTNDGNVTLTGVAVAETAFSGTGTPPVVTCPVTTLAPQASTTCTATYTAIQADADAGSVTNTARATGTPPSGPPIASLPSTATVTIPAAPAIDIVKSAEPAEAAAFTRGQPITYSYVVTNSGNVTLTDVAVVETDFTGNGPVPVPACPETTLTPAEQITCTATYHLTQDDIDDGLITNLAHATGKPPTGPEVIASASSVTIPADAAPALTLVKSASPATVTAAGQPVTWTFVATNTGNVSLKGVTVQEGAFSGTGDALEPACPGGGGALLPGAELTCTATYTVTQADIDAGSVTNTATARGTAPSGSPLTSPPSTATVVASRDAAIRLVKSASPAEATAFRAGQVITYSYTVTNSGNVTLDRVTVQETTFTGTGPAPAAGCAASTLAPAAQTVCTATYALTQADIDAGSLTNVATATGHPPSGPKVVSTASSVTIPQDPHPALTVVKSAVPEKVTAPGQEVVYTFLVTNTGNVSLSGVSVQENAFSGTGGTPVPACPASPSSLLPGMALRCTATYRATAADVDAGTITNTASAAATPPATPPVASGPSTASVAGIRGSDEQLSTEIQDGSTTLNPRPAPPPAPGRTLPRTGTGLADVARTGLALLVAGVGVLAARRRFSGPAWPGGPGR